MLGVGDRGDGGVVADAPRPPGDLGDVEHGVAPLDQFGIGYLGDTVVGPQDQVGHTDVEPAVQPRLPAADRVDPAERDGEPAERLPVQVVVELAGVVAVQAAAVTAGRRLADDVQLAQPGERHQRSRRGRGAQDRPGRADRRTGC